MNTRRIELRRREFTWKSEPDREEAWSSSDDPRGWIFNLLSLGIGAHEARIMRTLNSVKGDLKAAVVRADVDALMAQESRHYRAHDPLNHELTTSDPEVARFFSSLRGHHLEQSQGSTLESALRYLLLAEHCFGCMGRSFLNRPEFFAGADPDLAALWIYHSIEELEHTRVTFDVIQDYLGERGVLKLLNEWAERETGRARCDVTRDSDLQRKLTDKFCWQWLTDNMSALFCESLRTLRIGDLVGYFMSEDSIICRRDSGWYELFAAGWHPSARYDEDIELISHWDTYLRTAGYLH
jgi:hypothetical protein